LDRDGVLIEDAPLLVDPQHVRLLPGAAEATRRLHAAGFMLILVSNQAVVARGIATDEDVERVCDEVDARLQTAGGSPMDARFWCPHHPHADLSRYRIVCECRKPRPGLLLLAAAEHGIDLGESFTVGDRMTDVMAGRAAGTATVQVASGRHADPPIVTGGPLPDQVEPDHFCEDLLAASEWILAPAQRA
jgi:D-glycero-D-manno-heptose 1,7-bisphosphate phosphatase